MVEMKAPVRARSASMQVVVTRCGCGAPATHADAICPTPRRIDTLGTVSYYHANPLRNWLGKMRVRFNDHRTREAREVDTGKR